MTDLSIDWIAGFIDGEGCFAINGRGCPIFHLKVREDDLSTLVEIRAVLGGTINKCSRAADRQHGVRAHDQVELYIGGLKGAGRLIDQLEGHLRSKKRKDFEVWSSAVRASSRLNDGKVTSDRLPLMLKYKSQLQKVRKEGLVNLD